LVIRHVNNIKKRNQQRKKNEVDETVTLTMVRTQNRGLVEDRGNFIFESPRIKLIHLSETESLATWEFFLKYFEKGLSCTDCSLLVMTKLFEDNVYTATFDKHFKGIIPVIERFLANRCAITNDERA